MFAAATFLLSTALLASADRSLSLKVTTPGAVITDVDNLRVAATVANTGSETLRLLRDPRSPLSQFPTETFSIVNSKGTRAEFSGLRARYDPEGVAKAGLPNSIVELKPGESVTIEHDLAGVYNLTSTSAGAYTVNAANLFRVVEANNSLTDIYADLIPATVDVKGKLVSAKAAVVPPAQALGKRQSYVGCTPAQEEQIASAIKSAAAYAVESHQHLEKNGVAGSTRYNRWFGAWEDGRYKAVLESFSLLRAAPADWTYDCKKCADRDLYAYVQHQKYGTVYLCPYFWKAPAIGAGSRADTIIHEGTHFTKILGTKDRAYGQRKCLALAKSNPTNAVYNADNHAFFSADA